VTRTELIEKLIKVREKMQGELREELMDSFGIDMDSTDWPPEIWSTEDGSSLCARHEGALEVFDIVLKALNINHGSVGGLDYNPNITMTLH